MPTPIWRTLFASQGRYAVNTFDDKYVVIEQHIRLQSFDKYQIRINRSNSYYTATKVMYFYEKL